MPGFQLLMEPEDVIYQYDGSLAGFYGCVHTSVYARRMPLEIRQEGEEQCSLLPPVMIPTDLTKATRVREAIAQKISPRALELCEHVFLSCLEKKEITILQFLLQGFAKGARVTDDFADPCVAKMVRAERHLQNEAHLLAGFIRFAEYEGRLIATIRPKNFVLSLLAAHFADRYSQETFLIYDRTHEVALAYEQGRAELVALDMAEMPELSQRERYYQELWKRFYQTITIEERKNPRYRMRNMAKRYWENMVEVCEEA